MWRIWINDRLDRALEAARVRGLVDVRVVGSVGVDVTIGVVDVTIGVVDVAEEVLAIWFAETPAYPTRAEPGALLLYRVE